MKLVIVSGPEATGKTFIGRYVASLLNCQYVSKDMIKEALFESESHNTWNYSWYEQKAKQIFFDTVEDFINQNKTMVIESNFIGPDRSQLIRLLNDNVLLTEIYCTTKGLTSFKRFVKRNESGNRHKGHHDRRWYLKVLFQDLLRYVYIDWPYKPMNLNERVLILDNTRFSNVDTEKISDFISKT